MTPEQFDRLQLLAAKLFDVVAVEADPANWSGSGIAPKDLSREDRGDAVWCRRQAAASLSLLLRVESLGRSLTTGQPVEPLTPIDADDGDLDAEIGAAESAAAKLLQKLSIPTR